MEGVEGVGVAGGCKIVQDHLPVKIFDVNYTVKAVEVEVGVEGGVGGYPDKGVIMTIWGRCHGVPVLPHPLITTPTLAAVVAGLTTTSTIPPPNNRLLRRLMAIEGMLVTTTTTTLPIKVR